MSRARRYAVRGVAAAAAVAAIGLCAVAVVDEWDRVSDALATASPAWLVVAVLAAALAMVLISLGWGRCIAALGGRPPGRVALLEWYFAGELGKYLPGGIWPVLGRAELARRGGLSRSLAYGSVALSLVALYGAAVLPVGIAALHPAVVRWWRGAVGRVLRRPLDIDVPDLRSVTRLLLGYLPVWVAIAACTVSVAAALDVGGSPGRLAAATVAAWVVGFAVVPVPAGAGIREVVFVALAGLPAGLGVAVAVVCRLCFLVVDGALGAVASARLGWGMRRRGASEASTP